MSPGKHTDPAVTAKLKAMLEGIGKVPVICAARPGYIVPRVQSLAMNEAARMVEEGVASRGGYRQGAQIRLRLPLRRARHAGIHRLGRRRHPLLRLPLSDQGAGQRSLFIARHRRTQHEGRPYRPEDAARLSQLRRHGRRRLSRRTAEGVRRDAEPFRAGKAAGVVQQSTRTHPAARRPSPRSCCRARSSSSSPAGRNGLRYSGRRIHWRRWRTGNCRRRRESRCRWCRAGHTSRVPRNARQGFMPKPTCDDA